MSERRSTSTSIRENGKWEMVVNWLRDPDGHGWEGRAKWHREDGAGSCVHNISIRITQPLGDIVVTLDCVGYGAWATAHIPGSDLTNHDLQWATVWAKEAIRSKHKMVECNVIQKDEVTDEEPAKG